VRLFNPYYNRTGVLGQVTEWLWRAHRLNRRMHNKAWIADNRVCIVGGRNIGDEYFGASEHSNFSDLDVVLSGPVVADVSAAFDGYWNNPNAVPVSRFEGRAPRPEELEQLIVGAREYRLQAEEDPYVAALRDERKRAELFANRPPPLTVENVNVLVDDPAKVGAETTGLEASNVLAALAAAMSSATDELTDRLVLFRARPRGHAQPGERREAWRAHGGAHELARRHRRGRRAHWLWRASGANCCAAASSFTR